MLFLISAAAQTVHGVFEAIQCISSRPVYYNWHNQFGLNVENY